MTCYVLNYCDRFEKNVHVIGAFDSMERAIEYRDKLFQNRSRAYFQWIDDDKTCFDIREVDFNPNFEKQYECILKEN